MPGKLKKVKHHLNFEICKQIYNIKFRISLLGCLRIKFIAHIGSRTFQKQKKFANTSSYKS